MRDSRRGAGVAAGIILILAVIGLVLPQPKQATPTRHRMPPSAQVASAIGDVARGIEAHAPNRSLARRVLAAARHTAPAPAVHHDVLPSGTGVCPDPRTCTLHNYLRGSTAASSPRWKQSSDGKVTIDYSVDPTGALTDLSRSQIISAIQAAFATWHHAMPNISFVYDGTTIRTPSPGDGSNVIGFTQLQQNAELGNSIVRNDGGRIIEADMMLAAPRAGIDLNGLPATSVIGWGWSPCPQRDGSCTTIRHCDLSLLGINKCYDDLQNVVTHEIGHWLWLGDLHDPHGAEETMYYLTDLGSVRDPIDQRKKVTLGLGDVVGARELYPCGCPLPSVYSP